MRILIRGLAILILGGLAACGQASSPAYRTLAHGGKICFGMADEIVQGKCNFTLKGAGPVKGGTKVDFFDDLDSVSLVKVSTWVGPHKDGFCWNGLESGEVFVYPAGDWSTSVLPDAPTDAEKTERYQAEWNANTHGKGGDLSCYLFERADDGAEPSQDKIIWRFRPYYDDIEEHERMPGINRAVFYEASDSLTIQ